MTTATEKREEYRTKAIDDATLALDKARAAYYAAKTRKAKRDAAETLEFWGNRVAFLTHAK